jgi:hypothetical protein
MASPELPETQPNWVSLPQGLPAWVEISGTSVIWMRIPSLTGIPESDEVGYGEGGFGEGGYDSPTILGSDVPSPIWTVEDLK